MQEHVEKWAAIPGFPNYMVSTRGQIFSLKINKLLSPHKVFDGYIRVGIFNADGCRKNVPVHRLVALAFLPNPENKPHVDHLNTIRDDNRVENLRWVTPKENSNNPETIKCKKVEQRKKYRNQDLKGCIKITETLKSLWSDESYQQKMVQRHNTNHFKDITSDRLKRQWQDPAWVKKHQEATRHRLIKIQCEETGEVFLGIQPTATLLGFNKMALWKAVRYHRPVGKDHYHYVKLP